MTIPRSYIILWYLPGTNNYAMMIITFENIDLSWFKVSFVDIDKKELFLKTIIWMVYFLNEKKYGWYT